MRFVLALLAVIGLLASPAAAAAAQGMCHDHAMMSMAMTEMPGMTQAGVQKADPCCDPAKDASQSKHKSTDCAQACATMCGVMAALPSAPHAFVPQPGHDAPPVARLASLKPHEPGRLERPPRPIA
ncbi:hypothetical protein [Phenylobacterium soli]|uniref:CopL family metal-binding regulatory protein n=1 Tax=Phenylobacterium soli TaxID=2170551 RepID=A0A328ANC0_9CAUL|nr:hypothetical protein [Phenylobacterium soli]RAK54944.1 hypothetical protein DJ017_10590 [Phenylobacterium soli]